MKALFFFLLVTLTTTSCIYETNGVGQPPASPSRVTALLNAERNFILVSWADNSDNEDGFMVFRKSNAGWKELGTINNATMFIDDVGDIKETTEKVSYVVNSYNAYGKSEGVISNEVSLR